MWSISRKNIPPWGSSAIQQVGLYTITGSLSKIISFAAFPFFANTLTAGDMGILNIFTNSIVFLTPFVSMGVLYTISVDYFKLPAAAYARVFSTSLFIPIVLSIVSLPVLYGFREGLRHYLNFQPAFFLLIPLCLLFNFCFEAFVLLLRNQSKVKLFSAIALLKITLEIGLSVGLIILWQKNWYSRALGYWWSGAAIAGCFVYYIQKQGFLVRHFEWGILKKEIYFGLSGLLLQTAIFFINSSDKFFVMAFFGKEKAGYYAVAAAFAGIQAIVGAALLQYLLPILFKNFADNQQWKTLRPLYGKYAAAMLLSLAATALVIWTVYHFVLKADYQPYVQYAYWLCGSAFLWSIGNVFLQFLVFNKNKKVLLPLSVMALVMAASFNYISCRYFNLQWLCRAQIATNVVVLVAILFYNKKEHFFNRAQ